MEWTTWYRSATRLESSTSRVNAFGHSQTMGSCRPPAAHGAAECSGARTWMFLGASVTRRVRALSSHPLVAVVKSQEGQAALAERVAALEREVAELRERLEFALEWVADADAGRYT